MAASTSNNNSGTGYVSAIFKIPAKMVTGGLERLREQGTLCDINLHVEGEMFQAHRVVLAAASPYFEAMFSGKFKESTDASVTLQSVSSVGLKSVLNCMYSTMLSLNVDNVCDVLATAHLLQVSEINNRCTEFLSSYISDKTWLNFLNAAEKYSLDQVISNARKYVRDNFITVSKTKEFKDRSMEFVCEFFMDDELKIKGQEIEVYRAALEWIKHDFSRREHLIDVMKCIRFPMISSKLLTSEIFTESVMSERAECRAMIMEAMGYHSEIYNQPLFNEPQFRVRGKNGLVVLESAERVSKGFMIGCMVEHTNLWLREGSTRKFLNTPLVYKSMVGVQLGNFLFLFGIDNRYLSPVAVRYNGNDDTWQQLTPQPGKQVNVAMTAVYADEHIYLIGGMAIKKTTKYGLDRMNLSSAVSKYSIKNNIWTSAPDFPRPHATAACCSVDVRNVRNIYVAGGYTGTLSESNKMSCLATSGAPPVWASMASMLRPRCSFILEAVKNMLYAIGGNSYSNSAVTQADLAVPDIEVYDTLKNQWTQFQMPVGLGLYVNKSCATSYVIDNEIYILGGFFPGNSENHCRDIVVFDTSSRYPYRLNKHLKMKGCVNNVSAILTLPIIQNEKHHVKQTSQVRHVTSSSSVSPTSSDSESD